MIELHLNKSASPGVRKEHLRAAVEDLADGNPAFQNVRFTVDDNCQRVVLQPPEAADNAGIKVCVFRNGAIAFDRIHHSYTEVVELETVMAAAFQLASHYRW